MTCKNCINYEKCGGSLTNDFIPCDLFKNKTNFVELPCKVGDVVYELITIKDKSTKKINSHIVSRVVTSVHLSNRYSDKDKPYITLSAETFYKNGSYIKRVPIEAFGVTVFGTEREAEQKLKGDRDD